MVDKSLYSTGNGEHGTPQWLFDELDQEFDFQLDPCATPNNNKCEKFLTKKHYAGYVRPGDGLSSDWGGLNAYVNPPYGEPEIACPPICKKKRCKERGWHAEEYIPGIIDWVSKTRTEAFRTGSTNVMLVLARTDTAWFHLHIWDAIRRTPQQGVNVWFLKGRLKFEAPGNAWTAPFPSMIVVFRGGGNR